MATTPPDIPVWSDVKDAPIIYTDLLYHVAWQHGVARLAFVVNNANSSTDSVPADWEGKHAVTLVMPVSQMIAMRNYLTDIIDQMYPPAVVPPPAGAPGGQG